MRDWVRILYGLVPNITLLMPRAFEQIFDFGHCLFHSILFCFADEVALLDPDTCISLQV